ncbi:MAG: hypothetical protein JXM73_03470 [Anaerolineae bacterium]|nr:hypothetical protein [Anaerolineae bacterium]
MAKGSFQDELEKRATRALLTRAVYRWESAVIIGLTLVLSVLVPKPFPFWEPWFWFILGGLGEVGLVWTSLTDPEFRAKAVAEMFREKFQSRSVRDAGLRKQVEKAQEYRDRIDQAINKGREGVLRDHLQDVSRGITNWAENVYRLAARLDAYLADRMIHDDLRAVGPAIDGLKKRLALEDDDTVKRQISQTIAQKQIQRDNLLKLENVMEQAQFQLESTLTAMGTVYSQVMILSARDVASGRAQRLQQDVNDQVQALQDVVTTVDEVYQSGDALGLAVDTTAQPVSSAAGQARRKGTKGR